MAKMRVVQVRTPKGAFEFVERDMITAGAKILALMAIDILGIAER